MKIKVNVGKQRHKMSYKCRQELVYSLYQRYKKSDKKSKSKILDEFCKNTGYHRKAAITKFNNFIDNNNYKRERRGRKSIYNEPGLKKVLKELRIGSDNACAELFHNEIPSLIKKYEKCISMIDKEVKEKILKISISTIKRMLPSVSETKYNITNSRKNVSIA